MDTLRLAIAEARPEAGGGFQVLVYEREVERLAGDHSWETPDRAAGRLLLSSTADDELPDGLAFDWVCADWRDPDRFLVCLKAGDEHQIFLGFDWADRTPEQLASEIRLVLVEEPPARWRAAWHSIANTGSPPAVAGDRWTKAVLSSD